jgi:hypothetical protein
MHLDLSVKLKAISQDGLGQNIFSGVKSMKKPSGYGRDLQKERYWQEVIKRQEQSGQSVMEFCRGESISESAFYRWRSELKQRSQHCAAGEQLNKAPRFLPVKVAGDHKTDGGLELHLGTSCAIYLKPGFDRQTLMDVLAVLEAKTC